MVLIYRMGSFTAGLPLCDLFGAGYYIHRGGTDLML